MGGRCTVARWPVSDRALTHGWPPAYGRHTTSTPDREGFMPDTQAVVQRYLDEYHNGPHRWDRAEEILAPHYKRHGPPFEGGEQGPAEVKQSMAAFHEAFPDMHTEVLDRMVHDDRAVMVVRMTGTQSGR